MKFDGGSVHATGDGQGAGMADLNGILFDICFIRFRIELSVENRTNLLRDLVFYQRHLRRSGLATISEQAIRAWLPKVGAVHGPKRASAMAFLNGYLDWINAKDLVRHADQKARYHDLAVSLRLHQTPSKDMRPQTEITGIERALKSVKLNPPDPYMMLTLQVLASVTSRNHRHGYLDLPSRPQSESLSDEAYYALYRYDPSGGIIVKSFLVLKPPLPGVQNFASFVHFEWPESDDKKRMRKPSYRECEGVLLKFESSCCLLGYIYNVHEDKKIYPREYQAKRISAKLNPIGLETISFQYETVESGSGLYDGVSMTISDSNKPAISRVALLLVGIKGALGLKLNDSIVEPCALKVCQDVDPGHVIALDLRSMMQRVKALGPRRLPERYEAFDAPLDGGNSWDTRTGHAIARVIDNAAVTSKDTLRTANGRRKARSERSGRGALEAID